MQYDDGFLSLFESALPSSRNGVAHFAQNSALGSAVAHPHVAQFRPPVATRPRLLLWRDFTENAFGELNAIWSASGPFGKALSVSFGADPDRAVRVLGGYFASFDPELPSADGFALCGDEGVVPLPF